MVVPCDKDIEEQLAFVKRALKSNKILMQAADTLQKLDIKDCYIVAGTVMQSVVNYIKGYDAMDRVLDIDIQYYDEDVSYETEDKVIKLIASRFQKEGIKIPLDIKNEARAHIWIKEKWGRDMEPYVSVEDAVAHFVATIHSIAFRKGEDGGLLVYAPYGFNDLLKGVIRPIYHENNTREQYNKKVSDWTKRWDLEVVEWKG